MLESWLRRGLRLRRRSRAAILLLMTVMGRLLDQELLLLLVSGSLRIVVVCHIVIAPDSRVVGFGSFGVPSNLT